MRSSMPCAVGFLNAQRNFRERWHAVAAKMANESKKRPRCRLDEHFSDCVFNQCCARARRSACRHSVSVTAEINASAVKRPSRTHLYFLRPSKYNIFVGGHWDKFLGSMLPIRASCFTLGMADHCFKRSAFMTLPLDEDVAGQNRLIGPLPPSWYLTSA